MGNALDRPSLKFTNDRGAEYEIRWRLDAERKPAQTIIKRYGERLDYTQLRHGDTEITEENMREETPRLWVDSHRRFQTQHQGPI